MLLGSIAAERRDAGELERPDEPGQLELVGQRDAHDRKPPHRRSGLVREEGRPRVLVVLREERALGREPRVLERAEDGSVPERAHAHAVRARVEESDGEPAFAEPAAPLGAQAFLERSHTTSATGRTGLGT